MIRKATPDDIEYVHSLYMHPDVNPFLLYEPMSIEAFAPIYADLLEKSIKYVWEHEGKPMGMCKLIPFTYRSSHVVYLGGLAIDPAFGGRGMGEKLMQDILSFSKEQGFLRIELTVDTINGKAIRLYEKAGFEKEGILKKYSFIKQGNRYLDEFLMAYLF